MPPAGALPLELRITVLSFLDIEAIAVCACVSRQWREAAAQAGPRHVGYLDSERDISHLLTWPRPLSSVETVGHLLPRIIAHTFIHEGRPLRSHMCRGLRRSRQSLCEPRLRFACCVLCFQCVHVAEPCTTAHPLCRDDVRLATMVPVSVKYLSCHTPEGAYPDLAPLTRLTQLVALHLSYYSHELTQPLPPAACSLVLAREDKRPADCPRLRRHCRSSSCIQLTST